MCATLTRYRDVFRLRAQSHDDAFRLYPDACRTEVRLCLDLAALAPGEVLLDLPSAGGFLAGYLTVPDIRVIAVDPSPELHALCATRVRESHLAALDRLPLPSASVDAAICLAGLHHEPDPGAVFAEVLRVLKPGTGRLVVAEVQAGSPVAQFLNGFVNRHNPQGHQGSFVDEAFVHALHSSGLRIDHDAVVHYHWSFASRHALGDCLQRMLGIQGATSQSIAQAVEDVLGIDDLPGGQVGMRWSLRFFRAWRDAAA